MTELFLLLVVVPSLLTVYVLGQYWRALQRMGFADEVIGRAPFMFIMDVMTVYAALMVVYLNVHAWTGYSMTLFPSGPVTAGATAFVALTCFGAMSLIMRFNSSDRFSVPTVGGIRESAVRTLLVLRILDHAEQILTPGRDRRRA